MLKGNHRAGQTNKHFRSVEQKLFMKKYHLGKYATAVDIEYRVRLLKGVAAYRKLAR